MPHLFIETENQSDEFFSFQPQQQQLTQQGEQASEEQTQEQQADETTQNGEEQTQEQTPAAPVTIEGQTPEQIRQALAELAAFRAAEQQRQTDAETARQQTLSDVQREQERAQSAETAREETRAALEAEQTAGNTLRLRIAAQEAARTLGYDLHPSALDDALRLGDFADVQFNEAREPQGVTEAMKALVTRKPYLVAKVEAPNLDGQTAGRETGIDRNDPHVKRAARSLMRGF